LCEVVVIASDVPYVMSDVLYQQNLFNMKFLFISMLRIVLAKARQNFVLLFASLMVLLRNILPAAGPAKAGYSLRSWCV
jgi:hypothetical protein